MDKPQIYGQWVHPSILVPDVQSTIEFYTATLGFDLGFTWGEPVETAGLNIGPAQMLVSRGSPQPEGHSIYFVLQGVDSLYAFQREKGVEIIEEIEDKPWGLRQYAIRDLWGYRIGFGQHIVQREPKLPIRRVEVPVRLEERLAALLSDLASYKGMSVGECLEETLLHTFERLPDGNTPSPHTLDTFDHIELLKKRHGIEYDCHASYHFEESATPPPVADDISSQPQLPG